MGAGREGTEVMFSAVVFFAGAADGADVPPAVRASRSSLLADKVCSASPAVTKVVILFALPAISHGSVFGRQAIRLAFRTFSALRDSLICSSYHRLFSVSVAFR